MSEFGRFLSPLLKNDKSANVPLEISTSGIVPEVAREDIEKALSVFRTLGGGTDIDRAAQIVLQSLQVLSHRLDNPTVLKILYLDNPGATRILPRLATDTVAKLCSGEITSDKAQKIIDEAISQYVRVFEEMGVKPATISVLFSKPIEREH